MQRGLSLSLAIGLTTILTTIWVVHRNAPKCGVLVFKESWTAEDVRGHAADVSGQGLPSSSLAGPTKPIHYIRSRTCVQPTFLPPWITLAKCGRARVRSLRIRRLDRKVHCISTGADRLDPARICPRLASLHLSRLRNGVRSGKYAIERGDGPPSTVKDRTEDTGAPVCALGS
jgi:hypothetical protein